MNILLKLLSVHLLIDCSLAVEWSTSSGKYCTRKCTTQKEGNDQVYKCPVVDGIIETDDDYKMDKPGETSQIQWMDYCTPQQIQEPEPEPEPSSTVKPATLPALVSTTPSGSGSSDFNPGTANSMSSLKGFPCFGACAANQDNKYECPIKDHTKSKFFCSLNTEKLERKQVSSKNKMWCMNECSEKLDDIRTIHKCKTMAGEDLCSPSHKKSYKGNKCTSKCSLHKGKGEDKHRQEYMCSVAKDKMESCGSWGKQDKMLGEREKSETVDFTQNDEVCAGPCHKGKCLFVEWTDQPNGIKELKEKEGKCGSGEGISGSFMRIAPLSLIVFLRAFIKFIV